MNDGILIDIINQIPGGYEPPCNIYKGRNYRTVVFLDDFSIAQFFEVNDSLIRDWKKYDTYTSKTGSEYASMNLSLVPRRFIVAYHNDEYITAQIIIEEAKKQIEEL